MAAGDVTVFNRFVELLGGEGAVHDMGADTFKLALINNNATEPVQTAVEPRWQASGANPDYSVNEQTGGNYTTGGESLSAVITDNWVITGDTATFKGDDISIDVNASNPQTVYWGIIYNDSATNKECVAYIELGTAVDLQAGNFTITWDQASASAEANAIFDLVN